MGGSTGIRRKATSGRGSALSSRSVSMEMAMVMRRPLPSLVVEVGLQGALDHCLLEIKVGRLDLRQCKGFLFVHPIVGQSALFEGAIHLGLVRELLGLVKLDLIGEAGLEPRKAKAQPSRWLVGIDYRIVVIPIVVAKTNGIVGRLVLSLEDVDGIGPVPWLVDLHRSVEKLRGGLNLGIVPMDAGDALPRHVRPEGLVRDELGEVPLVLGHEVHAALPHFLVVVGVAVHLQAHGAEEAVAVALLLDHLEAALLERVPVRVLQGEGASAGGAGVGVIVARAPCSACCCRR